MMSHTLEMKDILNRLLFDNGLKVMDLARVINVPQPTLHRIVTGKCTNPHSGTLEPIAKHFKISIDQLKGKKPLPTDPFTENLPSIGNPIKQIPVYDWAETSAIETTTNQEMIVAGPALPDNAYATNMNDSSMEPQFPKDTILIFAPSTDEVQDRNYVIVALGESNTQVFRQLLIDGEHKFLSPLNPNSEIYKMRVLGPNDHIIGKLLEARFVYNN